MKTESKLSLILITVNQGYTDDVMNPAKKPGATGSTVVHARWAGAENTWNSFIRYYPANRKKNYPPFLAPNDIRGQILWRTSTPNTG